MADIANKDEAFKCLDIVREALRAGDHVKAEKFAAKALRLYRCDKTEAMVLQVQVFISEMTREGSGPADPSSNGTSQHHSAAAGATANGTAHHASPRSHQQQQQQPWQQSSRHRQHHQQHHPSSSTSSGGGGGGHQTSSSGRQQQQHQQPRGMGSSEGLRHRGHGGGAASARQEDQEKPEDPSVTPEQRKVVQQILSATCFYEVLGVSKQAGDVDIKQAYKKLALRLHPDKNKARKADEAFKLLSKAFSCLSSPDKRAYYDRTGYESTAAAQAAAAGSRRQQRGGGMGGGGPSFFYGGPDEFDPEEIFNAFFGAGAFNPHAARVFRSQYGGFGGPAAAAAGGGVGHRPASREDQQRSQLMALLQSEPVYSLAQDARFVHELHTGRLGVSFWVKEPAGFDSSYPPGTHKRHALERQVETDVYEHTYQRCQNERMAQHRAYTWGNREAARRMELASCQELGKLNERMGGYRQQQTVGGRF